MFASATSAACCVATLFLIATACSFDSSGLVGDASDVAGLDGMVIASVDADPGLPRACLSSTDYSAVNNSTSTYLFEYDDDSWANARARCEQDGAYLAVVEGQAENELLENELWAHGNEFSFWLGLSDEVEGTYKWVDGSDLTYERFEFGDDNNQARDCVRLRKVTGGRWSTDECSEMRNYVCECVP